MPPSILTVALSVCLSVAQTDQQSQPAAPSSQPSPPHDAKPGYLRVVEDKGRSIELQIASRSFAPTSGQGPTVTLVGVAHIGDASFYRGLADFLATFDRVLYESVKPPGAGGAGGETHEERVQSTKAAMRFIGGLIQAHRERHSKYPENLSELEAFAAAIDPRMRDFLEVARLDAWGQPLVYEPIANSPSDAAVNASQPGRAGFGLRSLGADGLPGGEAEAADLTLADEPELRPIDLSKEDNLQVQLADALDLEFQLEAMEYDQPNFRCSDMAMDEVSRRLQSHGIDFDVIGGTLAGSSLPAKVVSMVLGVMKVADGLLEGAIADTFKIVLIELLSDPQIMDQGIAQFGKGFGEVIINDRNQVVIDDLKQLSADEPEIKSVAIFYGAGHMNDMEQRLCEQLGYAPVPGEQGAQWLSAIKVDLTRSAVPPQEVKRIRMMIKQMMRQQLRSR